MLVISFYEMYELIFVIQFFDVIEDEVKEGGCFIDWYVCDLFFESWVDFVVVLRVDNMIFYDRLKVR